MKELRDRSLFTVGGGGVLGDHLIFRRTKGGITENFGRIQKETTQIGLENEDLGGIANVIKCY